MRRLIASCLFAVLLPGGAAAATLELVEVKPDDMWGGWSSSGPGQMALVDSYGRYEILFSWTPPPTTIDDAGFELGMTLQATGKSEYIYAGFGVGSDGLTYEPTTPDVVKVEAGQSLEQSYTATIRPRDDLVLGQRVRLSIGPNTAPGVNYYYQVTVAGGGGSGLQVSHDCPPEIVISALPSVNCHLIITGWRRNTADPVRVLLPNSLDQFGNHANGIQVIGGGEEDIFNWVEPYLWGLFVFACPGQQGTGANCYDSVTAPGSVTVTLLVQQGEDDPVPIDLTFTAVPHP